MAYQTEDKTKEADKREIKNFHNRNDLSFSYYFSIWALE